jgi:hypothetical protein
LELRDVVPARPATDRSRREISDRLAVVVGVGTQNSRRDAEAVAELLERDYGFKIDLLLDGEASAEAIEGRIARHLDLADAATQWLFYFAGHGWRTGGKGYLVPAGACQTDAKSCLSLAALCNRCLRSRCGEVLIVLDACHAGQALVRSEELDDRSSPDPAERLRIRQILCSANPDACALDGGGEPGHSVFTQSLLDALDGRAGVHDENGRIIFGSLRDWVVADVERRLQASLGPEPLRQKPIGGHLVGNEEQRDFTFQALVSRVPPRTVRDLRSDEAARRLVGLARLAADCRAQPGILPTAVALAEAHARPGPRREQPERVQAVKALYRIAGSWGRGEQDWPLPRKLLDASLGEALSALAVADSPPAARDWARRGLRCTSGATRATSSRALAERRGAASRPIQRRAWDAVVLLPEAWKALPWTVWWRIPLSRIRLWSTSFARALVETKARRRALVWPSTTLALLFLGLASTYYVSTWNGSRIVVRAGHPGFKILPGVGHVVVVTDFGLQQLEDPALAREERLTGSWLLLRGGALSWASLLCDRLGPAAGGLAEWRMGSEKQAFSRFREGIEAGEAEVVPLLGYVALHSDAGARSAVSLLVRALAGRETLHEPALTALVMVRDGRPAAAEAALAAVTDELRSASGAKAIARLEALEVLSELARPQGSQPPSVLPRLLHASSQESNLRLRVARAVKRSVARDPAQLAAVLPEVRSAILRGPAGERGAWLSVFASLAPAPPAVELSILDTLSRGLAAESDPARQLPLISSLGARLARSPGLAASYVPVVAKRLRDGNDEIRLAAARALASLPAGSAPPEAVAETLAALARGASSAGLRASAVAALGSYTHPGGRDTALAALIAAAAEGNGLVRSAAVEALLNQGLGVPASVPRILEVLRSLVADPNPAVRWNAAQGVLLLDDAKGEDWPEAFREMVRTMSGDVNSVESRVLVSSLKERLPRASPAAQRRIVHALGLQARDLDSFAAGEVIDLLRDLEAARPELLPAVAAAIAALRGSPAARPDVRGRAEASLCDLRNRSAVSLGTALAGIFELMEGGGTIDRGAVAESFGCLAAGHEALALQAARRLGSLQADPDPGLRAGVAAGLGIIGELQPRSLGEVLPVLLRGLASEAAAVRAASARALGEVRPATQVAAWATPRLLLVLPDRDPAVRQAAASALANWGLRLSGQMQVAIDPLRDRLDREADPEVRIQVLSALATLGGDDPAVMSQVIERSRSLLADPARERRAHGALVMRNLGEGHPRSVANAISILGSMLRDPDDWVRRTVLLSLFQIGASDAVNAARAMDAVGPLLLDPTWPSRWDAIANDIQPLVREQPSVAPRAVRLLRALLSGEILGERSRHLESTATEALVEALYAMSRSWPDTPWPLLLSASAAERQAGGEVLAHIAAEHPERIPAMLGRLSRYRRSLYPQIRLSTARTAEMLSILGRTAEVAGKPAAGPWQQVVERLPATVDLGAAVRLALDRLEPAVRHR